MKTAMLILTAIGVVFGLAGVGSLIYVERAHEQKPQSNRTWAMCIVCLVLGIGMIAVGIILLPEAPINWSAAAAHHAAAAALRFFIQI